VITDDNRGFIGPEQIEFPKNISESIEIPAICVIGNIPRNYEMLGAFVERVPDKFICL
jgi:hypothetical protein